MLNWNKCGNKCLLIISVNVLFTFLHVDTNGDDYLDTGELEALFVKEVSVIYKPDAYTL